MSVLNFIAAHYIYHYFRGHSILPWIIHSQTLSSEALRHLRNFIIHMKHMYVHTGISQSSLLLLVSGYDQKPYGCI